MSKLKEVFEAAMKKALGEGKSEEEALREARAARDSAEVELLKGMGVEELLNFVKDLRSENRKAFETRDAMKAKIRDLEGAAAELKTLKEGQMSEVEKLQSQVKELEGLRGIQEQYKSLSEVVDGLLTSELKSVPEQFHGLIPEAPPHQRLAWVREARAKGMFGEVVEKDSPGAHMPGRGGGNVISTEDLSGKPLDAFGATLSDIKGGKVAVATK